MTDEVTSSVEVDDEVCDNIENNLKLLDHKIIFFCHVSNVILYSISNHINPCVM